MQTFTGKGIVTKSGVEICSGSYKIIKNSHLDRQTELSGTFEVLGINHGELIKIFNLLQDTPPLVLIVQDGKQFNINLTLINDAFDFSRGFARFKILFHGNSEM